MRFPQAAFFSLSLLSLAASFSFRSCERPATSPPTHESLIDVIIILSEPPVATYRGGIGDYAATAPEPGRKIDFESEPVRRYQAYLAARQDAVFEEIRKIDPSAQRLGQESAVTNNLTARLSEKSIARVEKIRGVSRVARSKEYRPLPE